MEQQLILDRYRPLEVLGEGAFGSVELAWDTRMQRRVAIKRLPLPLDAAGRPHAPFGIAEARTAAMLNHPNIVTVFDFDTDSDEAFLVMEYVEGASLAEVLDDVGGPLTLDEAASVVTDISSALSFAHENGVLHLDVKPENVLIGRDGRAKVADFGIAELSSLGGHGSAWGGTLGYMPLEQLLGDKTSNQSDEWALAALTFEALTGENPFAADSPEAAISLLESGEVALPSAYERDLPEAVDDVVFAALAPRAEDRYEDVAQYATALLPHLGDPEQGRASLAELVAAYAEDELDEAEVRSRLGLWDRLQGRLGRTLVRGVAGAEAAWLAWAGLAPFGFDSVPLGATVGLVALAGLFAPGLGIGLGIGCFIAGLLKAQLWLIAALVILLGGGWWWFVARRSASASVLPLAAPVLALARLSFAQPLIAGFTLSPLRAALTGLLGGVLTMLASAASANGSPYLSVWPGYALDIWNAQLAAFNVRTLLTSPAAYMALLGWPAAAAFMSIMSSWANRVGAIVGAIGGSGLLVLAYLLAARIQSSSGLAGGYEGTLLGITVGASLILMTLVALLGAPVRGEEEDPFEVSE